MRILLATGIYPPESGGPATYTAGLAAALRKEGHHVDVLAYGNPALKEKDVTRISRSGGALIRYARYAWAAFRLARRADIVYTQGPVSEGLPATIGAWVAGRSVTMKVVGDYAWEMAAQRGETDLLDPFLEKRHRGAIGLYERIERWTARRARRIIVPSSYLKNVVQRWGVPAERIQVIPNANEPLPKTNGRESERRQLNVQDRIVILTAVRAVPWKGVAELIECVRQLPASHLLVVAGDGPMFDDWMKLAAHRGVADRVRFLGRIDRETLAQWYDAADVFALHSGYEGYPHVVAEAASVGLPCLVSDKGGNPETKETFGNLVQVLPYQNIPAWTAALANVTIRSNENSSVSGGSYAEMVAQTLATLRGQSDPMSVVMISYDRELLNASSSTFQRVMSLGSATRTIRPIVMQGRILRNVLQGIRFVRRAPQQTIVTAQDPFAAGLVGYLISRWTNTPLELQEHGDFYSGAWIRESWTHRVLAILGRFLLKRAERVRVVSDRVKQNLIRLGVSGSRIDVIPVSMDLSRLLELPLRSMSGSPRIIAPCRFVEQKGLDILLSAATLSRDRGVAFELVLIGSGPLESKLRRSIQELRLMDRVRIEPWRESTALWSEADLFVLPSRYEGFGRTIVEAMAAGVPIITTDVGCVGSLFRPQVDGRVVVPNDPGALAAAIQEQLKEPDRREAMRLSARERVKTFPSQEQLHERQISGWLQIFTKMHSIGPRFELWVGAFILFIIASRIASVVLFHDSLVNREWGFYYLVDHWFQGYGYSYARELGCASAYRSPGYLFFLTGLYTFFSPTNTWAHAIIQNIFVVGVLWLVYAVGQRFVGKRAALIGALLMACYPYTFYHYTQYYHTFLSSFFLLLLLWCVLRLTETKRYAYAFASGASIACLAYIQGTILPVTPFIVGWLLWKLWPQWKRALISAVIMAIVSAGMIAPWTYRNWKELHAFVPLTTDLGHAFFKANNEVIYQLTLRGYPQEIVDYVTVSSTNEMYKQYRMPPELEAQFKADGVFRDSIYWTEWHPKEPNGDVATCAELGPLDEIGFNDYWNERGGAWLRENWWPEGIKLQVLKLKTFWQPSLFPSVKTGAAWSFADSPTKVWLARNVMALASAVVIFGGLIGMFYAIRRRQKNVWLPIAFLIVYSILHTFFAGYTKYRIPLDNLLAMYAGWTLLATWNRLHGRSTSYDDVHDKR